MTLTILDDIISLCFPGFSGWLEKDHGGHSHTSQKTILDLRLTLSLPLQYKL